MCLRATMVILLAGLLLGCQSSRRAQTLGRIDLALTGAAEYLADHQSDDGAWRSERYGVFRDGPTLTPHVLSSLHFLHQGKAPARESFRRGVNYLLAMVDGDGRIDTSSAGPNGLAVPLHMPVYTAAAASWVVVLEHDSPVHRTAQFAFLALVRQHQLTEARGWDRSDPGFGGWGYSIIEPRKPTDDDHGGHPRFEANISATLYAIGALRVAKVPRSYPPYRNALLFIPRCQNFTTNRAVYDPRFDDGGFFFSPVDAARNKAGPVGTDRRGRQRFASYGSATADGVRALLQCGLPTDHPRVVAARRWLKQNFTAKTNPGRFNADREVLRDAYYFYYCWSVSHALTRLGAGEVESAEGLVDWAYALADELINRQLFDGSWSNSYTDGKEDDPLVATPLAAAALAVCRNAIAAGPVRPPKRPDTPPLPRIERARPYFTVP
ncbi:MAG: hypothetical protein V3U29_00090 [Phycisphaeraceae bacterium]